MMPGDVYRVPKGQYTFPWGESRYREGTTLVLFSQEIDYVVGCPTWICLKPDGTVGVVVFGVPQT